MRFRKLVVTTALAVLAALPIVGGVASPASAAPVWQCQAPGLRVPVFHPLTGEKYEIDVTVVNAGVGYCIDRPGTEQDPYGVIIATPGGLVGVGSGHIQMCQTPFGACLVNERFAAYIGGSPSPSNYGGQLLCVGSICTYRRIGTGLHVRVVLLQDSATVLPAPPNQDITIPLCVGILEGCP